MNERKVRDAAALGVTTKFHEVLGDFVCIFALLQILNERDGEVRDAAELDWSRPYARETACA